MRFIQSFLLTSYLIIVPFSVLANTIESDDSSIPEDLILEIRFGRYILSSSVFSYLLGGEVYLPLGEMANILKLKVDIDYDPVKISFMHRGTNKEYKIEPNKSGQLILYSGNENKEIWPDNSWLPDYVHLDQEIYLSKKYIEKIWPISIDFNMRRLTINIYKNGPVPELDSIIRKEYRKNNMHKQSDITESYVPGVAYSAYSNPLIFWNYTQSHSQSSVSSVTALRARSDIMGVGQNSSIQLRGREFGKRSNVTNLKWTGKYEAALEGDPKPIFGYIKNIEFGDVHKKFNAPVGISSDGLGITISTLDKGYSTFETQRIEGYAPSGWDADLYINQSLVDYKKIEEDGQYKFDVILRKGYNSVAVELNSPHGEKRVDRFTYDIKENYIPRGEWGGYYSFIQSGKNMFDLLKSRNVDSYNSHEVTIGYGLGPELDLKGHIILHEMPGKEGQYNGVYGWTSSGSLYGADWRWVNFLDSGKYHSSFIVDRDFGKTNVNFSLENYPDWPIYKNTDSNKLGKSKTLTLNVASTLNVYGRTYRTGVSYAKSFYKDTNEKVITSYVRSSIYKGSINSGQTCNINKSGEATCSVSVNLRREILNSKLYFDSISNFKKEWKGHEFSLLLQSDLKDYFKINYKASAFSVVDGKKENPFLLSSVLNDLSVSVKYRKSYSRVNDSDLLVQSSDWASRSDYSVGMSWKKKLKHIGTFLNLTWSDSAGLMGSFGFSGSILPGHGGYTAVGDQMDNPAHVFMYHDTQYNGVYDGEDYPMDGHWFRQGSKTSNNTDTDGFVWMNLSEGNILEPDLRSMDDPYQISGIQPYVYPVRKEKVNVINWPIISTGAIEGVILTSNGREHMNLKVDLYKEGVDDYVATIQSGLDGFYVFEFTPPGNYEIRVKKTDGTVIRRKVTVNKNDLWPVLNIYFD